MNDAAPPRSPVCAPPPAPPRGTDGVSVAALVTGLLGTGLVAVVLGILGVRRTRRDGTAGRGMAVAGIVLGALTTVGTVVAVAVLALSGAFAVLAAEGARDLGAQPAASEVPADVPADGPEVELPPAEVPLPAQVAPPPQPEYFYPALRACFTYDEAADPLLSHTEVPCEQVHDGQLVAFLRLDDGPFPGDDAVNQLGSERCEGLVTEALEPSDADLDTLQLEWFAPTRQTWEDFGDRSILCGVISDVPLTASLLTP